MRRALAGVLDYCWSGRKPSNLDPDGFSDDSASSTFSIVGISSAMLPDAEVTAVSVEFGTVPVMEVFKALCAENWLHQHGSMEHPKARELKNCLLRAFYPASEEWEMSVWNQGKQVIELALASLSL